MLLIHFLGRHVTLRALIGSWRLGLAIENLGQSGVSRVLYGGCIGFEDISPLMGNQLDKKLAHEMTII